MSRRFSDRVSAPLLLCLFTTLVVTAMLAQIDAGERAFPQSKATVENTLKTMQTELAGRLPVLEGFATAEHPLDRYRRGYYQASVQVSAAATGGSVVQISIKVTAWYADPVPSRSGYQLLKSNGRLEADLLDQLVEQLAIASPENDKEFLATASNLSKVEPAGGGSTISAPEFSHDAGSNSGTFSSSLAQTFAPPKAPIPRPAEQSTAGKKDGQLRAEVQSLEETLKNQAHPRNLVAVRKSGTPVVANPSLNAKPLFLASLHDEFEMLDFNVDWVHVRISGLSRGWIWRNSLEMPEGIPDTAARSGPSPSPAADLFHVTREETATFPGDWQPLRGKSVKIISVQKVDESAKQDSLQDKLEYAKFLLDQNFISMTGKPQELAGIVLIFDSADGGMIAATVTTLQQWKAGTLSDSALWHHCFFDPPETFNAAGSSGAE